MLSFLLFVVLAASTALESGWAQGQREKLHSALSSYVDKRLVNEIVDNLEQVKGSRSDVAVMFTDIRQFTAISELLPAEAVVDLLNQYLPGAVDIIHQEGGIIDKFIGDAIMAMWRPGDGENSADVDSAVRAALGLRGLVREFNAKRVEKGEFPIAIGVGLSVGQGIVGQIGDKSRRELTVIGDVVNSASRIESETVKLGVDILISEEVFLRVKDQVVVECFTGRELKGKEVVATLYKLIGVLEDGRLVTHDAEFDALYAGLTQGRVVVNSPSTLTIPDYRQILGTPGHIKAG